MENFLFNFLSKNVRLIGIIFISVGVIAWAMELSGLVYICPYCRVERSVITLLGMIMFLRLWRQELILFSANILAFFGAVVAVNQNFMSLNKISSGDFSVFFEPIYENPFLISLAALVAILLQITTVNIIALNKFKTKL